jgi:hypothetical protein
MQAKVPPTICFAPATYKIKVEPTCPYAMFEMIKLSFGTLKVLTV